MAGCCDSRDAIRRRHEVESRVAPLQRRIQLRGLDTKEVEIERYQTEAHQPPERGKAALLHCHLPLRDHSSRGSEYLVGLLGLGAPRMKDYDDSENAVVRDGCFVPEHGSRPQAGALSDVAL